MHGYQGGYQPGGEVQQPRSSYVSRTFLSRLSAYRRRPFADKIGFYVADPFPFFLAQPSLILALPLPQTTTDNADRTGSS